MKTLVVYDSVYGKTEIIARAIGEMIPGEVQVVRVGQVNPADVKDVDLLVMGSPTRGALPTEAVQGLVARIGPPAREGAKATTFDTRLGWRFLESWGGFAAPQMAETLVRKGWTLAVEPEGFIVRGLRKGPLKKGEANRAAAWAEGPVGS